MENSREDLAARKPLLSMFAGCLWLRIAERQLTGLLWNDPPRNTRDLPTAVGDMDGDELAEYIAELAAVIAKFPPGSRTGSACFTALQEALSGVQSLDWIGTFEDLCKSSDEWSAEVRSNFREFSDEDAELSEEDGLDHSARRIEPDEVDDFVTYLLEYGF